MFSKVINNKITSVSCCSSADSCILLMCACRSKLAFTCGSLNLDDCSLFGNLGSSILFETIFLCCNYLVARFLISESSPCLMLSSSYSAAADMISIKPLIFVLLFKDIEKSSMVV